MIRCIIVEDQPPAQRVLQKYIAEHGNMVLEGTFADALGAIEFLRNTEIDLIFLDIHLPKISGIDFLKMGTPVPNVILTTAFSDYALESYEYDVVDYLLKPFSFKRFVQAVSKMQPNKMAQKNGDRERSLDPPESLFIKSGYELVKVAVRDIRYIRSDADYTEIFTPQKKHLSQESLRHWEDTLTAAPFVRTHRSFMVNLAHIEKVVGNQVLLDDGSRIPIGRAYKEGFMERILE
ncbi:LytR/AlgR family response regulator transcription factor [Maribacter sp. 2307ULW6-5]|uniref:LytR/AlgR family response regulator transcription factor n=1 Tax=Maribacter sp. 2307ULW6-5 TaxID=3386275 RepID=UPI0039BCBC0E